MSATTNKRTEQVDLEDIQRPYFVYGTLRPGFGNSRLWTQQGAADWFDGEVTVSGFRLVHQGVPYAIATGSPDDVVVGCLIDPPVESWRAVRTRIVLDTLEGHPDYYRRTPVTADTPRGPVQAWIYTPDGWEPPGATVIPTGDYRSIR